MAATTKRKAYLAKLRKEDPEFYEAILASGELGIPEGGGEGPGSDGGEEGAGSDEDSGDGEVDSGSDVSSCSDGLDSDDGESGDGGEGREEDELRESDVDDMYDGGDDVPTKRGRKGGKVLEVGETVVRGLCGDNRPVW